MTPPAIRIRPYESDDEDAIIRLWEACGLTVPHNDPRKDIARTIGERQEWFLVGEVDGLIVAAGMAGYDGHRGSIYYLGVHPDHRGKGYGAAIVAEAERLLTEAGCPKINLLVRETNREVIAFYEKLGYGDNACVSLGKRLIDD